MKLPLGHPPDALKALLLKRLKLPAAALKRFTVFKRAHDARNKHAICFIYALDVEVADEAALRADGYSLGAGVVLPVSDDECGLVRTARIAGYLAGQTAGQCGPCRFGLPALAARVHRLAQRDASRRDLAGLERVVGEVRGRGACHHPDGAARLVATALAVFADDVAAHRRGRCLHERNR